MRFFTSDLHLGDKSVARWRGFSSIEEHDELIAEGLRRLHPEDELWILGDVCKANVASVARLRDLISCERVHIVIGNHDSGAKFLTHGGFASVDYYAQVGRVVRDGYKFVMSHYPMLDWDRAYHGSYMLHGHIHSLTAERVSAFPAHGEGTNSGMGLRGYNERNRDHGIRRFDVGVDANGYLPVSAEQIVAFFPDDATWYEMHGLVPQA
ncbi:MAG: metallophosphoesterase family protein [Atopobiaceae bacterium]|nr:metallophosphoesterase family protein [Atopobiaceae bacterium]